MFPILAAGSQGYQISRSVRLRSAASAYFSRTFGTPTNNKVWTWSGWVKRGSLTTTYQRLISSSVNGDEAIRFDSDRFAIFFNGTTSGNVISTAVFRDPSAWYHALISIDTTQATAANRVKLYINGSQLTGFSTANYPAQNYNTSINAAGASNLSVSGSEGFDGYLTEVNFIDGQALTPASFGEYDAITGVWKPKKYTGTYGTNGFYLNFADNSAATAAAIGKDYSGNGNNWTPNNISVTAGVTYDSMIDVPTMWADGGNGRGNYAVLNPLQNGFGTATLIDGNLALTSGASANINRQATIFTNSGKFYYEGALTANIDGYFGVGAEFNAPITAYRKDGTRFNGSTWVAYGATYTTGDVIGCAYDLTSNTVEYFKNGVSQGSVSSIAYGGANMAPLIYTTTSGAMLVNFGQRPFAYTPPTGFKALNTQNLPEPTIKKGSKYLDVQTYTGSSSDLTLQTTIDPTADALFWFKMRSAAGTVGWDQHFLVDSKRLGSGNKYWADLISNSTAAEAVDSRIINSFTANSITKSGAGLTNENGKTYVQWAWQAGATQGFDIVTYTGAGNNTSVNHSLGVAPAMVIVKQRSATPSATEWVIYHKSLAAGEYLLFTTAAKGTLANWISLSSSAITFPTSSTGTANSGSTYVAYAFAEVAGFSKFGSISANGAADNAFVYTGFLPRFVLLKRTDTTSNWIVWDTARNTYNVLGAELYPNLSNAESTVTDLDLLSNGFKLRNASFTGTWIYAAFATAPFKNSLAF